MAVIIEFVGPPGAGKTTHCRYFATLLKEKNYQVVLLQNVKDYIREMSFLERLYLFSKILLLKSHTFLYYTLVLALNRIYSINSIYRYIRLSIFNLALHQYIRKKDVDIVLLEQWVIQELWSATIFRLKSSKDYEKIKKDLKVFYFKIDFVLYLDIEMAVASERITMRNTSISRFDRMDPDERLKALIKYNTYLFQLYENSACNQKYLYTTENSPEVNAGYFLQHLNYSLNTQ